MFRKIIRRIRGEQDPTELKKLGLSVGKNFSIQKGCTIDSSHCYLITIGDNVTFAPNVQIFAHDASTKNYLGYTKIGLVKIGDNAFLGASTIVLPGVEIGKNCIIGAGSVVAKSIPEGSVVAGNPARKICTTEEYLKTNRKALTTRPIHDKNWTVDKIDNVTKANIKRSLKNGLGYIK